MGRFEKVMTGALPFLAASTALLAAAAALLPTRVHAGPVITWVPPYSVDECKAMVKRDFGGVGMKDGLTFLALQWWVTDGPNIKAWGKPAGDGFDNDVKYFRDWGKANGVKVTLCVVNHVGNDWNWAEARRSFIDNRAAFVKSLVAEVDRLGLDGVELDLEGPGTPTANDSAQYVNLVRELGAALNPLGKTVTVASFAAQYNAPNWKWWPELMKTAAAVTSMGYDEAGMNNPSGYKYPEQKKRANPPNKLMIGMFGGSGSWQGNSASEQIDWVVSDGQVGLGIWDAALGHATWESAATWTKLGKIRANTPIDVIRPELRAQGTIASRLTVRPLAQGLSADLILPARSDVRVRVFNVQGGEVAELYRGIGDKGTLTLSWPGVDARGRAAKGAYILSADVDGQVSSKGFTLAR
jgi:hypothetical protein